MFSPICGRAVTRSRRLSIGLAADIPRCVRFDHNVQQRERVSGRQSGGIHGNVSMAFPPDEPRRPSMTRSGVTYTASRADSFWSVGVGRPSFRAPNGYLPNNTFRTAWLTFGTGNYVTGVGFLDVTGGITPVPHWQILVEDLSGAITLVVSLHLRARYYGSEQPCIRWWRADYAGDSWGTNFSFDNVSAHGRVGAGGPSGNTSGTLGAGEIRTGLTSAIRLSPHGHRRVERNARPAEYVGFPVWTWCSRSRSFVHVHLRRSDAHARRDVRGRSPVPSPRVCIGDDLPYHGLTVSRPPPGPTC